MVAWVALIVSLFVALIGFVQWRTANLKVMLDLFDRRWKVYTAAKTFLNDYSVEVEAPPKIMHELRENAAQAIFLFGPEIPEYLGKLIQKARDQRLKRMAWSRQGIDETDRLRLIDEESELVTWLLAQRETLHEKFAKYMNISVADEGAWKSLKHMLCR